MFISILGKSYRGITNDNKFGNLTNPLSNSLRDSRREATTKVSIRNTNLSSIADLPQTNRLNRTIEDKTNLFKIEDDEQK